MPDPVRLAYSVPEAAALIGISASSLHRQIRAGAVPHVRIGRRIVVPRQALERWLNDDSQARSWESSDVVRARGVQNYGSTGKLD